MAATLAQFRSLAPLVTATDAVVNTWLDITLTCINPDLFGTSKDTAQVWLAAHQITLQNQNTTGIPMVLGATSVTVGPVSVGFSGSRSSTSITTGTQTIYSQRYEALAKVARLCAASLLMGIGTVP